MTYKVLKSDKYKVHYDEIIIKKSKFLGYLKKVETEKEAIEFINEIKKIHNRATHNCSAYVIGKNNEIVRCSDDGEPTNTAGKPMLDILIGSDIKDCCAVVTRYFGGIKLGTGGLVRAYSDATRKVLENCETTNKVLGKRVQIHTDYNTVGKILYELGQRLLKPESSEYNEDIVITVVVPTNEFNQFEKKIIEISSAKSTVLVIEEVYIEKVD